MAKQDPAARRVAYFAEKAREAKRIAAAERAAQAADKWQAEREAAWERAERHRALRAFVAQVGGNFAE